MATTPRILAVGSIQLANASVEHSEFDSGASLLDYDIVLFRPSISAFLEYHKDYNGRPSLDDYKSFRLKEAAEHWRSEIKQAVGDGKFVMAWLPALDNVYVATGRKEYSGTGRNQRTTRIVEEFNYLKCLPIELKGRNSHGKIIKPADSFASLIKPYIEAMSPHSEYQVILEVDKSRVCITANSNSYGVGAIYRTKSNGALVLLPDIDFHKSNFFRTNKKNEEVWSDEGLEFSSRLIDCVLQFWRAVRASSEFTVAPNWTEETLFELPGESDLKAELLLAEKAIEDAQMKKEELKENLVVAGKLRELLFEKGKPLENAVLEALRLMGFTATQYKEGNSEFDVVFECQEGRLIGEVEGKDTKPINVEKLRQLAMNINEDLQRESVKSPAKPVLFGNGYRLSHPEQRENPFTEKCKTASATSSTALVSTSDLFKVAQTLKKNPDDSYAAACRTAILNSVGRVRFPNSNAQEEPLLSDGENSSH